MADEKDEEALTLEEKIDTVVEAVGDTLTSPEKWKEAAKGASRHLIGDAVEVVQEVGKRFSK